MDPSGLGRRLARGRTDARRLVLGFALLALAAAVPVGGASGAAQRTFSTYDVQQLDTLGGGFGSGASINDAGWVAGSSTTAAGDQHAALWRFGSVADLGTFGGAGTSSAVLWPVKNELGAISGIAQHDELNALGEIWSCGRFFGLTTRNCSGFVWRDGHKRALATLGGYNSFATGTNNGLQTVGWAENDVHEPSCRGTQVLQFFAVLWGPGEGDVQVLPPLEGDQASAATAIDDEGRVIGISGECDRAFGRLTAKHSVVWENGVPVEIGDLGGGAWNTPMAINRKGDVVGFANRSAADGEAFRPRAFLSTKPGKVVDLGALGDDPYSQALGINDDRQVVGVSYSEGFATCRAFLWEHGVMTDLNDLASDYAGELCSANDIDDLGRITGDAIDAETGRNVAFLATPQPAGQARAVTRRTAHSRGPAVGWDAIRDVMLRSGVRPEDLKR